MPERRGWDNYPFTYRTREMKIVTAWFLAGESGSVVGLPGCGRSNLLGFLCNRPDALQFYLQDQSQSIMLIPIDLDNLPAYNLATLYRVFLRAFYQLRDHFTEVESLPQTITNLYQEHKAEKDPFLCQSALHELLDQLQAQRIQIVLVLNRFDDFCQTASPHLLNSIRGLRNKFKGTLSYIVGMRRPAVYLPNPAALGEIYYELFDIHVCWVGAMVEADARQLLKQVIPATVTPPSEAEIKGLFALSGGFPALLRVACQWWLTTLHNKPPLAKWQQALLKEDAIQHRLDKMWHSLTQEEQLTLGELQKTKSKSKKAKSFYKQQAYILQLLTEKGICHYDGADWHILGQLMAGYIANIERPGLGRVWFDKNNNQLYQGQTLLQDITAMERKLLQFFIEHPHARHTKSELIFHVWPDERYENTSEHSLYQIVMNLRKKIEPDSTMACYLVTWRARRPEEGGYQFFPEGKAE